MFSDVQFSGILSVLAKASDGDAILQHSCPAGAFQIKKNTKEGKELLFKLTLLTSQTCKPRKKDFKSIKIDGQKVQSKALTKWLIDNPIPSISLDEALVKRDDHQNVRRSWVYYVDAATQSSLQAWTDKFCRDFGLDKCDYDKDRMFHLSVFNLTGNAGDSVK